ncbi:lysozyme inhibitor LprI family protein [Pseudomonas luteola]|uniref:lysozyme inhibitor LprI family protein n=1 Tax=Pseudomonas TaxID=286 RepID=UPI003DA001DC
MHKIDSGGFDGGLVPKEELSQSLRQSQRAWLKFRDDNCEAYYTLMSGGLSRNEDREVCLGKLRKSPGRSGEMPPLLNPSAAV